MAPEIGTTALSLVASLLVVLAVFVGLILFSKRVLQRSSGASGTGLIRILASQYIGVKKQVSLVEVPGAILVLGVSADRIVLLSEINAPEAINTLKKTATARDGSPLGQSFQRLLRKLQTTESK